MSKDIIIDNTVVEEFYKKYPYPRRNPSDIHHSSILPANIFAMDRYIFQSKLSEYKCLKVLVAGCGTGDAAVALINQTRQLDISLDLHCVDISKESLEILRGRIANLAPSQPVKIYCQSIEDFCRNTADHFDYIDLCGVINHVADQILTLSALGEVLSENGGIGVMAYGKYGREGVYPLQKAFLKLSEQINLNVSDVRDVLQKIKPDHPFLRNPFFKDFNEMPDEEVADLFLNPRDKSFTVEELFEICQSSGLHTPIFLPEFIYNPNFYFGSDLEYIFKECSPKIFPELAEGFFGNIRKHCFFVTRNPQEFRKPTLSMSQLRFRLRNREFANQIMDSIDQKWLLLSIQYEGFAKNIRIALPVDDHNFISDLITGKKFGEIANNEDFSSLDLGEIADFILKLEKTGIGFVSSV